MRLYGSLTNRIMETIPPAVPEVGMGGTIVMWSDRYPVTIIGILRATRQSNPTVIRVQGDKATRLDKNGMSETQEWSFERDEKGDITEFSKRRNGTWVKVGDSMKSGTILRVGKRDRYYDFSF